MSFILSISNMRQVWQDSCMPPMCFRTYTWVKRGRGKGGRGGGRDKGEREGGTKGGGREEEGENREK